MYPTMFKQNFDKTKTSFSRRQNLKTYFCTSRNPKVAKKDKVVWSPEKIKLFGLPAKWPTPSICSYYSNEKKRTEGNLTALI